MSLGLPHTPLFPGFDEESATRRNASTSRPGGPLAVTQRPRADRAEHLRKPQAKDMRSTLGPLFDRAEDSQAPQRRSEGRVNLRATFGQRNGHREGSLARVGAARACLAARNQPLFDFERPREPRDEAPTPPRLPDDVPLTPTPQADPARNGSAMPPAPERTGPPPAVSAGEKAKAREILEAIRTLKRIEADHRPATPEERVSLARFGGFGAVALSIFPDPVRGTYKDDAWEAIGEGLKSLLTADEYASAKRTTFNAFYTSPTVICAMWEALTHLGVSPPATVLEPGGGIGRFLDLAPEGMRFIGV